MYYTITTNRRTFNIEASTLTEAVWKAAEFVLIAEEIMLSATAPAENGPRYEHDCDNCRFVGRDGPHDCYVCGDEGSVVRRASSDPADYGSFPREIAMRIPPYARVLQMEEEEGR